MSACPDNSPSLSTTDPTVQKLTGELHVANGVSVEAPANGPLKERVCQSARLPVSTLDMGQRSNGAIRARVGDGWDYDEDPLADHPFGAYYHWCALLCGFSEAALEHGLLSELQLEALRPDLEASLPGLQACRQLLVVIPASLEEHPHIVELLRDGQTLGRLRRIHHAFGDALREEQMSRELDWLLYEH